MSRLITLRIVYEGLRSNFIAENKYILEDKYEGHNYVYREAHLYSIRETIKVWKILNDKK